MNILKVHDSCDEVQMNEGKDYQLSDYLVSIKVHSVAFVPKNIRCQTGSDEALQMETPAPCLQPNRNQA